MMDVSFEDEDDGVRLENDEMPSTNDDEDNDNRDRREEEE